MLDKILEYALTAAAAALIGGGVALITTAIIGEFFIKKEVKKKCPEAFKVLILEKKKKAVKCGIFDCDDDYLDEMEFESEKGVSSKIYVGQEIYL